MRHRSVFLIAMVALTVGAFAFRLPVLGNRPFHGDEAVHAFKFQELWERGVYRYDHNEFHGPTLYYAALPSVWLQGRRSFAACRESDFRLPIILFGAAMVLALAPLPFAVRWIDPRRDAFPTHAPANVTLIHAPEPAAELVSAPDIKPPTRHGASP